MGTTCTVKYTATCCASHKEDAIIPKFKDNLIFFRQIWMISFVVWNNDGPHSWKDFAQGLTVGIFPWEVLKPFKTVNF